MASAKWGIKMFFSRVPEGSRWNNHIKHFSFAVHWVSTNPIRFWLGLACRHAHGAPWQPLETYRKAPQKHPKTHTNINVVPRKKTVAYFAEQRISPSQFACHNFWLKFSLPSLVWVSGSWHVWVSVCLCICVSLGNLTWQLAWHT